MSRKSYPKHPISIDCAVLRAAQQVTAGPKDDRRLLQGICLEPDGFVQACNGITAFRSRTKTASLDWITKRQIIFIHTKLPRSHDVCELEWSDAESGIIRCVSLDDDKEDALIVFEVLEEKKARKNIAPEVYPDLKSVVPTVPVKAAKRIAISADQLALPKKVYGGGDVMFENRGTENPLVALPLAGHWQQFDAMLVMATSSMLPDDTKTEQGEELNLE